MMEFGCGIRSTETEGRIRSVSVGVLSDLLCCAAGAPPSEGRREVERSHDQLCGGGTLDSPERNHLCHVERCAVAATAFCMAHMHQHCLLEVFGHVLPMQS